MSEFNVLLSTIDNRSKAAEIARELVERRLVACVNIVPNLTSIYRWNDAIEEATEFLMIIKSTSDRVDQTISALAELHPYEVPEILALPIVSGHSAYLAWIREETQAGSRE